MDGEDRVEADQDSGGEEEVAHFLGFLQLQISHPEEELPNAARTIRDLVRSSNVLTKYYQRFQNQGMTTFHLSPLTSVMHAEV